MELTLDIPATPMSPSSLPTPSVFGKQTEPILSPVTPSAPLSLQLRVATGTAHRNAETSAGAKALLSGKLPQAEYVRYLILLWHVYDALESALDTHSANPCLSSTYNPSLLRRADAIASDVSHFLQTPATSWQNHPTYTSTPALLAYTSRLRAIEPARLLAHSYVRYLGDLSGGQIIKRILLKAYGPDAQGGMSFYEFNKFGEASVPGDSGDIIKLKTWFRTGMDEAAMSDEEKAAAVDEALLAFKLNEGFLDALDATAGLQEDEKKSVAPDSDRLQESMYFGALTSVSIFAIALSYLVFRGIWASGRTMPLPFHLK